MNQFSDIPQDGGYGADTPPDGFTEEPREPLANIEAELSVLGTLLSDASALDRIEGILKPDHFAFEGHARLYELCRDAIHEHRTADPITIRHHLEMSGELERFGGNDWFASVVVASSGPVTAKGQAMLIRDLHYKRGLAQLGRELSSRAIYSTDEARQQIEMAERQLSELVGNSVGADTRSREEAINSTLRQLEASYVDPGALTGRTTGLERLDRKLLGLQDTDLIILAGATSMGKTALGTRFAESNAHQFQVTAGEAGTPVGLFSLEMSAEQLNMRLVADRANVPLNHMRKGQYQNENDWLSVVEHTQALGSLPLYIEDGGGMSALDILHRARRMKRTHGVGLFVIDQLSHIRQADPRARRVEGLGQITKDMKAMAKELEVPVVLLHQLNREVGKRDDTRPMLSDLRDSGEVEQDADVVLFVHRYEYYLERAIPAQKIGENSDQFSKRYADWETRLKAVKNTAEIIIAKQRMGNIGSANVAYHGPYTRFQDLDRDHRDTPSAPDTRENIPQEEML